MESSVVQPILEALAQSSLEPIYIFIASLMVIVSSMIIKTLPNFKEDKYRISFSIAMMVSVIVVIIIVHKIT